MVEATQSFVGVAAVGFLHNPLKAKLLLALLMTSPAMLRLVIMMVKLDVVFLMQPRRGSQNFKAVASCLLTACGKELEEAMDIQNECSLLGSINLQKRMLLPEKQPSQWHRLRRENKDCPPKEKTFCLGHH